MYLTLVLGGVLYMYHLKQFLWLHSSFCFIAPINSAIAGPKSGGGSQKEHELGNLVCARGPGYMRRSENLKRLVVLCKSTLLV